MYRTLKHAYPTEVLINADEIILKNSITELFKTIQPGKQHIVCVKLYSLTCVPCLAIANNYLRFSKKYSKENEIYIVKQHINDFKTFFPNWNSENEPFKLNVVPTFLLFINGIISHRIEGPDSNTFLYKNTMVSPSANQMGVFHLENIMCNTYNCLYISDEEYELNNS